MDRFRQYLRLVLSYVADNPRTITIIGITALILLIFLIIHVVVKRKRKNDSTSLIKEPSVYPEEPGLILDTPAAELRNQVLGRLAMTTGTHVASPDLGSSSIFSGSSSGFFNKAETVSLINEEPSDVKLPSRETESDMGFNEPISEMTQAEKEDELADIKAQFAKAAAMEKLEEMESLYRSDADNITAMEVLAPEYLSCGRVNESLEIYKRLILGDPDNPVYIHGLGLAYEASGNMARAVEQWELILTLTGVSRVVQNEAKVALERANERFAKGVSGAFSQDQGTLDDGEDEYEPTYTGREVSDSGLSVDDDLDVELELAPVQFNDGDMLSDEQNLSFSEADSSDLAVFASDEKSSIVKKFASLATGVFKAGNAFSAFSGSTDGDASGEQPLSATDLDSSTAGKIADMEAKVAADPDNTELLDWLAFLYYSNDMAQKAIETYGTLIRVDPDICSSYYYMGNAFLKLEQEQNARDIFQYLIEEYPENKFAKKATAKLQQFAEFEAFDTAEAEEAVRVQAEAEEAARVQAEAEEAARVQAEAEEAARVQAEAEEAARVQAEAEEAARVQAEAEEAARVQAEAEEAARVQAEAEEAARVQAEAEEVARVQAEAEEAARVQAEAEEAARVQAEAEEAARVQAEAEEAARVQAEAEEAARVQAEAEETARVQAEAEEAARVQAEAEEAARVQAEAEEATRVQAEAEEVSFPSEFGAIEALEMAYSQEPDNFEVLALLAETYLEYDMWDKAEAAFISLEEEGHLSDDILFHWGTVCIKLGDPEEAITQWNRLLCDYPQSEYVPQVISRLIDAKKAVKAKTAETYAQEQLEADGEAERALAEQAAAEQAAAEQAAAEQAAAEQAAAEQAAVDSFPNGGMSLDLSGLASFLPPSAKASDPLPSSPPSEKIVSEMTEKEEKRMKLLLKDAFPDDQKMWKTNISELGGVDSGVSSRLEVYLEKHLEQWPAWEFLGFCYQVQGLYTFALRVYQYLLQNFPEEPRYHYYIGNVYSFRKKRKEAMRHYADALTLDPDGLVGNRALKKISKLKAKG